MAAILLAPLAREPVDLALPAACAGSVTFTLLVGDFGPPPMLGEGGRPSVLGEVRPLLASAALVASPYSAIGTTSLSTLKLDSCTTTCTAAAPRSGLTGLAAHYCVRWRTLQGCRGFLLGSPLQLDPIQQLHLGQALLDRCPVPLSQAEGVALQPQMPQLGQLLQAGQGALQVLQTVVGQVHAGQRCWHRAAQAAQLVPGQASMQQVADCLQPCQGGEPAAAPGNTSAHGLEHCIVLSQQCSCTTGGCLTPTGQGKYLVMPCGSLPIASGVQLTQSGSLLQKSEVSETVASHMYLLQLCGQLGED